MKKLLYISLTLSLGFSCFVSTAQSVNDAERVINSASSNKPVAFYKNNGQIKSPESEAGLSVFYKGEVNGADIYLCSTGLRYVFYHPKKGEEEKEVESNSGENETEFSWIDVTLTAANINEAHITTEALVSPTKNFYYGNSKTGICNVQGFEKIIVQNIYAGIDWILYSKKDAQGKYHFKYDFVLHPGAKANQILLSYSASGNAKIDSNGSLYINTDAGIFTESVPYCYESKSKKTIACRFQSKEISNTQTQVRFDMQDYNKEQEVTIDPMLSWGTIIGGSYVDGIMSADCDANGNLYVCGYTASADFPTLSALGAYTVTMASAQDAFLMKFDLNGNLIWSTYYGGSGAEFGFSIHLDNSGNAILVGSTGSSNFPCFNAGTYFDNSIGGTLDAFIVKFSSSGARLWATFYGGSLGEEAFSAYTDNNDNIWVCGHTYSPDLPTLSAGGYFDATISSTEDAFILKFDSTGNRLWASYYGGNHVDQFHSLACDNNNNMYVCGYTTSTDFSTKSAGNYTDSTSNGGGDAVILKFSPGTSLLWSSYYGGSSDDDAHSLNCDKYNQVFVMGVTHSSNFPVLNAGTYYSSTIGASTDVFILKFDENTQRLWSTYFGGNNGEYLSPAYYYDNIETDTCGSVYIAFNTSSLIIPVVPCIACYNDNTLATAPSGASWNTFIAKFSNNGALAWSSYLGAYSFEVRAPLAIDKNNTLYVLGESNIPALYNPGGGAYYIDTMHTYWDESFINKFVPVPFSTRISKRDACDCSGRIYATNLGEPPFTFEWSTGTTHFDAVHNTDTLFGLCPGDYSVTVTDAYCRKDTLYMNIVSVANTLTAFADSIPSCGNGHGTAYASAINGYGFYTFEWSSGQVNDSTFNLRVGNYFVVVTDSIGCTDTAFTLVDSIPSLPDFQLQITNSACHASNNGSIIILHPAGINLGFDWTPSVSTNDTAINLSPGLYQIHLYRLDNNCDTNITVLITEPADLSVSAISSSSFCSGNFGTASMFVSGGTLPYSYLWSNGDVSSIADSLFSNTYTGIVIDANNCRDSVFVLVEDSTLNLLVNATQQNVRCHNGSDGEIHITTAAIPLTFIWLPPVSLTATATGLSAGLYSVYIASPIYHTCDATLYFTISEPDSINLSINASPDYCSGNYGSAYVIASGGVSPFTYIWSNGSNNDSIFNLTLNTYSVVVSDSQFCSDSASITIADSSVYISSVLSSNNVICNGDSDGFIIFHDSLNYTYTWLPPVSVSHKALNLAAGTYTVLIQSIGHPACDTLVSILITEPAPLLTVITAINGDCSDGISSVSILASGGIGPYSYQWNNGDTNSVISNINSGLYTVSVQDNNACISIDSAFVFSPEHAPDFTYNIEEPSCFNFNDASIHINTSIGDSVVYSWIPSISFTDSAINLSAGNYSLQMHVYSSPCDTSINFTIKNPVPVVISVNAVDETCLEANGSIAVSIISGRIPVALMWSNGSSNSLIDNLSAGNYSLTVTDSAGCEFYSDTFINNVGAVFFSLFQDTTVEEGKEVSLYIIGLSADSVVWSTHEHADTIQINASNNQLYSVCMYDKSCMRCDTVTVNVLYHSRVFLPTAFSPNQDGTNDIFKVHVQNAELQSFEIFSRWGEKIFSAIDAQSGWNGMYKELPQPVGVYVYVVKYFDKLSNIDKVIYGNVSLIR